MIKIDDGRVGGGYTYQWYVVLYLIDIILNKNKLEIEGSILSLLKKYDYRIDELKIHLEGNTKKHEDFEIYNLNKDGLRDKRILFQVKTTKENTNLLLPKNIEFLKSINNFQRKDNSDIVAFVFVTNEGFRNVSKISQTYPVQYNKLFNKKNRIIIEKEFELKFELKVNKLTINKLYIWNTPKKEHLVQHLLSASSFERMLVSKSGFEIIANLSTKMDGSSFSIQDFVQFISSQKQIVFSDKYQKEANEIFINNYSSKNKIPSNKFHEFFKKIYVKRQIDYDLEGWTFKFSNTIFFDSVNQCIEYCQTLKNRINKESGNNNNEKISIINKIIDSTKELKNKFSLNLPTQEIMDHIDKIESYINGGLGKLHGYSDIQKIKAEFNKAYNTIKNYKNVIIITGVSGIGKTFSAYRYVSSLKWFYAFSFQHEACDFENVMTFCARQSGVGTTSAEFLEFIRLLQQDKGEGAILLDGIDESKDFNPSLLLALIDSLYYHRTTNVYFVITCRSDYIAYFRKNMNFTESQVDFRNRLQTKSHLLFIPRLVEQENTALLIRNYCNIHKLSQNIGANARKYLNYRFTPRILNHIFLSLSRNENDGYKLPDNLILCDIVSVHLDYVYNDLTRRMNHKYDIDDIILFVNEISKFFIVAIISNENHKATYESLIAKFDSKILEVFKMLINNCNELEIDSIYKSLRWVVPDIPFHSVAYSYFQNYFSKIEIDNFQDLLELISSEFSYFACDIAIHLFYKLHYASSHLFEHSSSFLNEIAPVLKDQSYGKIAIGIIQHQLYGQPIEFFKFDNDTYKNVSDVSGYEFLVVIAESIREFWNNDVHDLTWCIDSFLSVMHQCLDIYDTIDMLEIRAIAIDLFGYLLHNPSTKDLLNNLSLLNYLGTIHSDLFSVEDELFRWARDSAIASSLISELDIILHYMGSIQKNHTRNMFVQEVSCHAVRLPDVSNWLVSDARIYECTNFYPRKCIVNEFVKASEHRIIIYVINSLDMDDNIEKRRNALFIYQQYSKYNNDLFDLYKFMFNYVINDENLEIVSTAIGIVLAEIEINDKSFFNELIEYPDIVNNIERKLSSIIYDTHDANGFCKVLLKYRGIFEVLESARDAFDKALSSINDGVISHNTYQILSEVIIEEKNMENFLKLANALIMSHGPENDI